jgi:hypothetical protein
MSYSGESFSIVGTTGVPVSVTSGGALVSAGASATRSDTYTVAASGVKVVAPAPVKSYSILVKGTGAAATAWNVVLEGSLDNVTFTTILTDTQATGDGVLLSTTTSFTPSLFFRSRLTSITLAPATNIIVTILGMA